MVNIHTQNGHFTPDFFPFHTGFLLFHTFYAAEESRLKFIFWLKMWIIYFLKEPVKEIFEEANTIERPVYGTFCPQRPTVHFIIPQ